MAVVDAVVPFLLNNITQLLKDEVDLLSGVEDKVVSLQKKLNIMNGFLQDTEGKRYNHEVKAVINQIRDDTNEAQDVIDNYVAYKHEQSRRGFWGKSVHSIDYATMLHSVNTKIENLQKSIDDIYANKDKYDIQKGAPTKLELRPDESLQKLRMKVAEDEEVVGFDNHAKEVTELLKEGGSRLDVVSIVGMGGLGKTTLARKVYKNDDVKNHFDCCAWASVSQDFRPRDVLTSLLRCLKNKLEEKNGGNNKDEVSEEEVVEILKASVRKELKGLRYLIVLDDIKSKSGRRLKMHFPPTKMAAEY